MGMDFRGLFNTFYCNFSRVKENRRKSFVIPRTLLYRGSLNRGSLYSGNPVTRTLKGNKQRFESVRVTFKEILIKGKKI